MAIKHPFEHIADCLREFDRDPAKYAGRIRGQSLHRGLGEHLIPVIEKIDPAGDYQVNYDLVESIKHHVRLTDDLLGENAARLIEKLSPEIGQTLQLRIALILQDHYEKSAITDEEKRLIEQKITEVNEPGTKKVFSDILAFQEKWGQKLIRMQERRRKKNRPA
jgi:hypothetical protein